MSQASQATEAPEAGPAPEAKYRKDYQPAPFTIDKVALDIDLNEHSTRVISELTVRRQGQHQQPLVLDGESLTLVSVQVDGQPLEADEYQIDANSLTIGNLGDTCTLRIESQIDPANNTALEGLYKSGEAYCTQCEAEGFRRITYYLDRPDVLAEFTTTVRADRQSFPFLLSNGNKIAAGDSPAYLSDRPRHYVTWHDPHPKPSYLFAVVAGDFDLLEDTFTTQEGRHVDLQLFVDKGNVGRAQFAMQALRDSMRWDETRFGLSYDLDIYMIVAVDFFNMGAMENKGLNVFNAKYVLGDPETATDQDFLNIESVIGHEYFHNWTGNRITCRDWFQLSLKEGLTVFRDQEFSGDQSMRAVHRINDVRVLRTHQFAEDAGPMAHPIRPDKVIEMNNFYTVTVYNKGAEVIRMIHTLLGETQFQQGMRCYIERHDGQAVTCEDFLVAMEGASGVSLQQFRRWYEQAGTPVVSIEDEYDEQQQTYTLHCRQHTPATPGQPQKQPFVIPMRTLFYNEQGHLMQLHPQASDVLQLTEAQQEFRFEQVSERPIPALFAGFSAPVKIQYSYTEAQRLTLLTHSDDAFIAWDSAQQIYQAMIDQAITAQQPVQISDAVIEALQAQLGREDVDPALVALLLQLPSEEAVAGEYEQVNVEAISTACTQLRDKLAARLKDDLWHTWRRVRPQGDYQFKAATIANRMLANTCLSYLALVSDAEIDEALQTQFDANNLTDQLAALQATVHGQHHLSAQFTDGYATQWHGEALVMDKWLAVQASTPGTHTLQRVQQLTEHSAFSFANPNRIYALLATFSHNLSALHQADGEGYQWLSKIIERLNDSNPQVASRLLTPLLQWRRFDSARQQLLKAELQRLRQLPNLANDLFEKIESSLTASQANVDPSAEVGH